MKHTAPPPPPHRRVCPEMWSFLGDLAFNSPGLAHEVMEGLGDRTIIDMGENVVTRELAAGITPEEFNDGPVFHPAMAADAAPSELGEKAA